MHVARWRLSDTASDSNFIEDDDEPVGEVDDVGGVEVAVAVEVCDLLDTSSSVLLSSWA